MKEETMNTKINKLGQRVEKGAKLLDKAEPSWWKKTNLKTLEMGCGANCVLGQLYFTYHAGSKHLGIKKDSRNGFALTDHEIGNPKIERIWNGLWREQIHLRIARNAKRSKPRSHKRLQAIC